MSIIAAHVGWVTVNSVSETMASSPTLCSTSSTNNPSSNGPCCSMDTFPTSSMPSTSPNYANISTATSKGASTNAHLIIAIVTLVVKDFPLLDFASLSPSVSLISSPPSPGSEMALQSLLKIILALASGSFSSRQSRYSKAASATYGFRDNSLRKRERKSSPLNESFGRNLNMNTPSRLDLCKKSTQCETSRALLLLCNKDKIRVLQTASTVYSQFSHLRMRKG